MIDRSDGFTPLRNEVMAGRGLVAVDLGAKEGAGRLASQLHEAALVTGRRGDVRTLVFDGGRCSLDGTLNAYSTTEGTRPCPRAGTRIKQFLAWDAGALGPIGRRGERLGVVGPYPHPDPEHESRRWRTAAQAGSSGDIRSLDLDDLLAPGRLIHIRGDWEKEGRPYLVWLVLNLLDRAEREDRDMPVVFGERVDLAVLRKGLSFEVYGPEKSPYMTAGRAAEFARAFAPDVLANARWRRSHAAAEAALILSEGEGYAIAEAGGRASAVFRGEGGALYAVCVDADRWAQAVALHELTARLGELGTVGFDPAKGRIGPDGIAELARIAYIGGIEAILHIHGSVGGVRVDPYVENNLVPALFEGPMAGLSRLDPVRALLRERLDLDLQDACASADNPSQVLSWALSGGDWRRQFVLAYPILADLGLEAGIGAVVDAGEPVAPELAARLGVGLPVVRRLAGRRGFPSDCYRPTVGPEEDAGGMAYGLGEILAAFGHDRLPRAGHDGDWAGFRRGLSALMQLRWRARAAVSAGDCVRLLWSVPGPDWEAKGGAIGRTPDAWAEAGDVANGFRAWLDMLRTDGLGTRAQEAFDVIGAHASIVRVGEVADRWHDTPRLVHLAHDVDDDEAWLAPFRPVDLGDGWSVRPLTTAKALRSEGAHGPDADGIDGLSHCVANYAYGCARYASVILSMRLEEDGLVRRVSTVEIVPHGSGTLRLGDERFRLAQHRAMRNEPPPDEAVRRLNRLFAMMADGEVQPEKEFFDLRERRKAYREDRFGNARLAADLHPLWRPLLPQPYAGYSLVELCAALGIAHDVERRPPRGQAPAAA